MLKTIYVITEVKTNNFIARVKANTIWPMFKAT